MVKKSARRTIEDYIGFGEFTEKVVLCAHQIQAKESISDEERKMLISVCLDYRDRIKDLILGEEDTDFNDRVLYFVQTMYAVKQDVIHRANKILNNLSNVTFIPPSK